MRMALSNESPGTAGVLNSLLALASIRRHGSQPEALKYRGRALAYLNESIARGLQGTEPCSHVATGMILSAYEVSLT